VALALGLHVPKWCELPHHPALCPQIELWVYPSPQPGLPPGLSGGEALLLEELTPEGLDLSALQPLHHPLHLKKGEWGGWWLAACGSNEVS
jgi:hypothetical protein